MGILYTVKRRHVFLVYRLTNYNAFSEKEIVHVHLNDFLYLLPYRQKKALRCSEFRKVRHAKHYSIIQNYYWQSSHISTSLIVFSGSGEIFEKTRLERTRFNIIYRQQKIQHFSSS
jgi:hypothetical protein